MSKVDFKLNSAGVRELLKSPEMQGICREYGANVLSSAGDGYVMEDRSYPERSGVVVRPDTPKAFADNLNNNTLLKALGGGR